MKGCFWAANGTCAKDYWPYCGYDWLISVPLALLWSVWFFYGLMRLRQASRTALGLQFDVAKIHDPLAQGMAIALSQRKSATTQRRRFQRYMKLGAMWAEWPTLTYTPLTIGFKVAGAPSWLQPLYFSLNFPLEVMNLSLAVLSCCSILVLRHCRFRSQSRDYWLKKYVYPVTFDVLYIPLTSTFVRLATCPEGYPRIALPGGGTCDCVDRFGIFWALGFTGFVALYVAALHYKMHIEPLATTMDFRFQTSFQIIMVMARTLNPIVSMLVSELNLRQHQATGILIAFGFFGCMGFLFTYNHKVQPCIGSGRLPNNIRALTFSSAMYSTVATFAFVVRPTAIVNLYYSLVPLPVLWIIMWRRNDRRATQFHIADKSILGLLCDSSPQSKAVGTIAALYMDPAKLHPNDYCALVTQIGEIAKPTRTHDLVTRIYALRILWFCHIHSFRKQKRVIGEADKSAAIPFKLFFKDVENATRKAPKPRTTESPAKHKICTKIHRIHHIKEASNQGTSSTSDLHAVRQGVLRMSLSKFNLVAPFMARLSAPQSIALNETYHIVAIRGKRWIAKEQTPQSAVTHHAELLATALDTLNDACMLQCIPAMHECAVFLLEWYESRYMRLSKASYLHVLTAICATRDLKRVVDATHTLHKLCLDGHLSTQLWLQSADYFNNFSVALDHPNPTTVYKCATVLALVLQVAEKDPKTNPFVMLTPEAMNRVMRAVGQWTDDYRISATVEAICMRLYSMEVNHQRNRAQRRKKRAHGFLAWLQEQFLTKIQGGAVQSSGSMNIRSTVAATASRRNSESYANMAARVAPPGTRKASFIGRSTAVVGPTFSAAGPTLSAVTEAAAAAPPQPEARSITVDLMLDRSFKPELSTAGPKRSLARPDKCILVTPVVLKEVERRRATRRQLEELLRRARAMYEDSAEVADAPVARGRRPRNHDLAEAKFNLVMIYTTANACALSDFVETGLEMGLRYFFEAHVRPMIVANSAAQPPAKPWQFWRKR
ncbi:hypothetical protein ACHHYP_01448 [Achlya hypogyna]|uniref:Uncharacterized protein n=1 Tax=Achlya hypogyna TaxID=1202772 RepID=A0A1V9Z8U0_ACHHY|nr:hypothetical protein ACHHYP_01448 [Achlya hypogyna]